MEFPSIVDSIFKNLVFKILIANENNDIVYFNDDLAKLIYAKYLKHQEFEKKVFFIKEINKWFEIIHTSFSCDNTNYDMYQFDDITLEKLKNDSLEKVALYDPRTNALNLNGFKLKIDELRRKNDILSIIMIDLDDFKSVNDKYSHSAGDLVLMEVVKVFLNNIRANDLVCRYGGDEFVIVLDNCFKDNAFEIAENIRKEIENTTFDYNDFNFKVTITIGLKECLPTDNFDEILKKADSSLYEGKNSGKNIIIL